MVFPRLAEKNEYTVLVGKAVPAMYANAMLIIGLRLQDAKGTPHVIYAIAFSDPEKKIMVQPAYRYDFNVFE